MALTYFRIASNTVSSATSAVTFSGISSAYTDLILTGFMRPTNGGGVGVGVRFNSDSGGNYEQVGQYNGVNNSAFPNTLVYGAIADNVYWSGIKWEIMDYASTTIYKNVLALGGNDIWNSCYQGLWRNTNAITSISIVCDGGSTIQSGSIFSLYGILRA